MIAPLEARMAADSVEVSVTRPGSLVFTVALNFAAAIALLALAVIWFQRSSHTIALLSTRHSDRNRHYWSRTVE
jgi:hypothetical protein